MKNSIQYVTDVLGVREILLDPQQLQTDTAAVFSDEYKYLIDEHTGFSFKSVPPFLILHFENDPSASIFLEPQRDLFRKMLLALKLNPQQILALEVRGPDLQNMLQDITQRIKKPIRILVFTRQPTTVPEEKIGLHMVYQTFSPTVLLQKPELKKASWDLMQKFRG